MAYHQDIVFYELRRKFPNASYIEGYKVHDAMIDGLVFWGSRDKMNHQLVLLCDGDIAHIVHRYQNTVFVMADAELPPVAPQGNAIISLGEKLGVGQAFNRLADVMDLLRSWEQGLNRAANEFFSYESIVRSCDSLLQAPLALMDADYHYVAYSRDLAAKSGHDEQFVDENGYLPLEYINIAVSNPGYADFLAEPGVYRMPDLENGLHKNVFFDGQFVGRLTLPESRDEAENAFSTQVLLSVADQVERLYAVLGTFYRFRSNDARMRKVFCDLLDGLHPKADEMASLLENRGFHPGDSYYLLQFRANIHEASARLGESLSSYVSVSWPGCFGFTYGGKTLMLANATFFSRSAHRDFEQEMAVFLRESLLVAGLSRSFSDIHDVGCALLQTDIALSCGQLLDPMQWFPKFEDYAFWHLAHNGSQGFEPYQICDQALNVLREHDLQHGTEFNHTLATYMRERYNAVAAARALRLSRSAFLKRMSRISELTSLNIDDPRRRLYLALSYELFGEW